MQPDDKPVGSLARRPTYRVRASQEIAAPRHCRLWLAVSTVVLASCVTGPPLSAEDATPAITLADAVIRIPSGVSTWTRKDILIKAENLDPAVVGDNPMLSSQDLYIEGPSDLAVRLGNFRAMPGTGTSRVWLADAEVSKLPPDSSFKRRILFTYGKVAVPVDYTVTNRPEGTFSWSVKSAVKELLLNKSREISLVMSTGEIAATNVHVALATLQDETSKDSLGREYLHLCVVDGSKCNTEPFSLARHTSSQPVKLKVDDAFWRPGVFKGMIWIGVDQKQDPDSFELTVYSTRLGWQLVGTVSIILGVVLWWFVSVFARQRAARADALTPIIELRDSIDGLLSSLDDIDRLGLYEMGQTRARLERIKDELDPNSAELSPLIPPEYPSISGLTGDMGASLKQYVDARSAVVSALSVLVEQGGSAILSKRGQATAAGKENLIRSALQALDDAAGQVKTADEAQSKLRDIVNGIETGLVGQTEQDVYQRVIKTLAFAPSLPTTKELRLESRRLSFAVWVIWGGATVLVGVVAMILTNQGFGTALDYIKCFLWGFSIQAVGQQLQQLTPGSVTTSLKIPVSK